MLLKYVLCPFYKIMCVRKALKNQYVFPLPAPSPCVKTRHASWVQERLDGCQRVRALKAYLDVTKLLSTRGMHIELDFFLTHD